MTFDLLHADAVTAADTVSAEKLLACDQVCNFSQEGRIAQRGQDSIDLQWIA